MNREIKFRARNNIDKSYIDWMTLCGMPKLITNIARGKEKHYKLEQYTGLKDKNGVEIYEGDIVECWDTCGFENISQALSGEVVFMGGCFCVKGDDGYHNRLALTCAENVEVTGNIHQQN